MLYSDIKKEIRKSLKNKGNYKILLNMPDMTFKLVYGDCLTDDIDFPCNIKRQIKIEKLLNGY